MHSNIVDKKMCLKKCLPVNRKLFFHFTINTTQKPLRLRKKMYLYELLLTSDMSFPIPNLRFYEKDILQITKEFILGGGGVDFPEKKSLL